MENGTACAYFKSVPDANRIKIVRSFVQCSSSHDTNWLSFSLSSPQIEEVSSAVSYLHQAGVVHGDLKGVSASQTCR